MGYETREIPSDVTGSTFSRKYGKFSSRNQTYDLIMVVAYIYFFQFGKFCFIHQIPTIYSPALKMVLYGNGMGPP